MILFATYDSSPAKEVANGAGEPNGVNRPRWLHTRRMQCIIRVPRVPGCLTREEGSHAAARRVPYPMILNFIYGVFMSDRHRNVISFLNAAVLIVILVMHFHSSSAHGEVKPALPESSILLEANKAIETELKSDLDEADGRDEKAALAVRLVEQAKQVRGNPTRRYAMSNLALHLASDSGDALTAVTAVRVMGQDYEIDALNSQVESLKKLSKSTRTKSEKMMLTQTAIELSEAALALDRYDLTEAAGNIAIQVAKQIEDASLITEASLNLKNIHEVKMAFENLRSISDRLDKQPVDRKANLEAAKFYCFLKDDWKKGLAYLLETDDENVKPLAEQEKSNPIESAAQIKFGDAWWAASEKATGITRDSERNRAAYWYRLAASDASVSDKAKTKIHLDFLDRQQAIKQAIEGARLCSFLTEAMNKPAYWKSKRGTWEWGPKGTMTGKGDSWIDFLRELPPNCRVSFDFNVLSGMRPRFFMSGFMVGNEGYSKTIFIYGGASDLQGKPIPYGNGTVYHISIAVHGESIEVKIGDQTIRAKRKHADGFRIALQGGDGWSRGATEYANFKVKP